LNVVYKSAAEQTRTRLQKIEKRLAVLTTKYVLAYSIDGSWQKRGRNSFHGLVTTILGDKCD